MSHAGPSCRESAAIEFVVPAFIALGWAIVIALGSTLRNLDVPTLATPRATAAVQPALGVLEALSSYMADVAGMGL